MPVVYLVTCTLTQKKYVGKANDVKNRWKNHRFDASRSRPKSYLGRAIRKYGLENFSLSVLEECPSEEAAYAAEVKWISALKSNQPGLGYNLDSGGMGGKKASFSTRELQSSLRKGRPRPAGVVAKMHTPEAREKAAISRMGYRHTEETRNKMSLAAVGHPKSPSAVEKSAVGHRGRHLSEAHRIKLSKVKLGVPHSIEHRLRIAEANRLRGLSTEVLSRVRYLATQGLTQTEIAYTCGISQSSVSRILIREVMGRDADPGIVPMDESTAE